MPRTASHTPPNPPNVQLDKRGAAGVTGRGDHDVPDPGVDPAASWDCYLGNVALTCEAAARAGLTVIIEPIGPGTLAGYYLNHPDFAMRAIEAVGAANLLLSFDTFHASQAGVDLFGFTAAWGSRFGHVQIADDPGRHEPLTAGIDFAGFFHALDGSGYRGAIGLEYLPMSTTMNGLGWVSHYAAIEPLKPRPEELP